MANPQPGSLRHYLLALRVVHLLKIMTALIPIHLVRLHGLFLSERIVCCPEQKQTEDNQQNANDTDQYLNNWTFVRIRSLIQCNGNLIVHELSEGLV